MMNTGDDSARLAAQVESAADAVLEGKQLLIDLDRRNNATREAKNALRKQSRQSVENMNSNNNNNKPSALTSKPSITRDDFTDAPQAQNAPTWILCNGGTFVSFSNREALERLDKDQKETLRSIDEARDALKDAVAELARLEGPDSALARLNQGFDLKAAGPR